MRPVVYIIRHPSAGLLFVQLLGVLLYPLMEDTPLGRALFGAFGLVVLGLALHVVKRSSSHTWVAVVLAVLLVTLSVINNMTPAVSLESTIALLEAVFYFYAAGTLIAYMNADYRATTDELYAVGPPSRCSPGPLPICTPSASCYCRAALVRLSTPRRRAAGWSCCFSASPPFRGWSGRHHSAHANGARSGNDRRVRRRDVPGARGIAPDRADGHQALTPAAD